MVCHQYNSIAFDSYIYSVNTDKSFTDADRFNGCFFKKDIHNAMGQMSDTVGHFSNTMSQMAGNVAGNIRKRTMKEDIIGYCAKCGKPITYGHKFCISCGTPVPESMIAEAEAARKAAEEARRAEEAKREAEAARKAEEAKRKEEARREEAKRIAEEQRKSAESVAKTEEIAEKQTKMQEKQMIHQNLQNSTWKQRIRL